MRTKLLFTAECLAISIVLFALWKPAEAMYASFVSWGATALRALASASTVEVTGAQNAKLLIPVLATLSAAAGIPWKQKVKWLILGVGTFLLFDTVTVATGVTQVAELFRTRPAEISTGGTIVAILYHGIVWILPFVVLTTALEWRLEALWTPLPAAADNICPLCGRRKTGLAEHIKAAHGEKALKNWKAKSAAGGHGKARGGERKAVARTRRLGRPAS